WRIWADPMIHGIHMRVLRHVASLSEAASDEVGRELLRRGARGRSRYSLLQRPKQSSPLVEVSVSSLTQMMGLPPAPGSYSHPFWLDEGDLQIVKLLAETMTSNVAAH